MLWAWGDDASCQLGHTPPDRQPRQKKTCVPQHVAAAGFQANIASITAGEKHNLALDELGGVYVWGRTREGQCGIVQPDAIETPTLFTALAHEHVVRVACGADVSYALTAGGAVYQFGAVHAPSTELAHNDLAGYGRSLEELSASDRNMIRNSLAQHLAAAGDDDDEEGASLGGLVGLLDEEDGKEGGLAEDDAVVGTRRVLSPEPTRIHLPDGERGRGVAGGFGFAVVLLSGGGAAAFGLNDRFQCGLNDRVTRDVPRRIGTLGRLPLVAVACGQQHAVVVDHGGLVYSWGMGSFGQLGHGKRRDEPKPRHVMLLAEAGACVAVACGQQHSVFLVRPHGGGGHDGGGARGEPASAAPEYDRHALDRMLEQIERRDEPAPTAPEFDRHALDQMLEQIERRSDPTPPTVLDGLIAMATEGPEALSALPARERDASAPPRRLFGCGHAEYGQLGTGDVGGTGEAARDFPLPRRIPMPSSLHAEPVDVRCGALHTVVVTKTGEVASFGWGSSGALGHGTFGYELEARPVAALALKSVTAIAAGGRHTLALESAAEAGASLALMRDLSGLLLGGADADCVLEAGRHSGARRFLCHRGLLACRCPRLLAMLAFHTSRFIRCGEPSLQSTPQHEPPPPLPPLHWTSQAQGGAHLEHAEASLRLPRVRAPIFALLLTWLYTERIDTTEQAFLSQLHAAARRLRLPALGRACEQASATEVGSVWRAQQDTTPTAQSDTAADADSRMDLPTCLTWLLHDGSFADDVKVVATDGALYASRALLCCRCQYVRTLLHGGFREGSHAAGGTTEVDLRLYQTSLAELRPLLRYMYTGFVVEGARASNGTDLALLDPALALSLLPHAAALLMDDLKRLCEAVLVASTDVENAEALLQVAEACFAQRLRATCQDVLSAGG